MFCRSTVYGRTMPTQTDSNEKVSTIGSADEAPIFFNPLHKGYFDDPYAACQSWDRSR